MLLVAVGAATGCHKQLARAQPPAVVKVGRRAVAHAPQLVKEWVATIDGSTTAEIRPQVSGYIQQVNYKEGSRIDVGELLFTIDDRPFVAAVKKAQGDYETALAQLAKARADVARYTPLVVDHAISHEQLDDARAAVQAGEATMAGAKGTLDSGETWTSSGPAVRSPIAGLTGLAQVRVGALVNTNQILTIVSTVSSMRASFSVSQQDYLRYADEMNAPNASEHPGVEFELILIDGRIYPHRARQVFVNRQIDATTGTLQIQALFPNPDGLLRPGLFAKVRLHGSNEVAPVVPERAVSQLQGQYQVTVIDSQQRAQIRRIDVGLLVDHVYAVDKGLRPGELVVVEGQQNILPGAKVNVEQLNGPESQAHFGMRN